MSLGYGKLLQFLTEIKKLSGDRVRDREVIAPLPRGLNPQKAHPMHLNAIVFTLPRDGTVIACDVKNIARSWVHYRQSAVKSIDANKENYQAYYESSLQLLKTGGLIAIYHVL